MRIALIFTGGTIGCTTKKSVQLDANTSFELLEQFNTIYPNHLQFDTFTPFTVLSENIELTHLEQLLKTLEELLLQTYDGIIIMHGSDTLHVTAPLVGTFFSNISIPVCFVASHKPLDNPHTNALDNFNCAIHYIVQKKKPLVVVCYKNPYNTLVRVHQATQLLASVALSDDFYSVTPTYGTFDGHQFILQSHTQLKSYPLKPVLATKVLTIHPIPGLMYEMFNLDTVDVVLHGLYHSGTTHVANVLPFLQRCQKKDIPVYFVSIPKVSTYYESTHRLQEEKTHFIYDTSFEEAYVKILLAYGNQLKSPLLEDFLQN